MRFDGVTALLVSVPAIASAVVANSTLPATVVDAEGTATAAVVCVVASGKVIAVPEILTAEGVPLLSSTFSTPTMSKYQPLFDEKSQAPMMLEIGNAEPLLVACEEVKRTELLVFSVWLKGLYGAVR